MNDRTDFNNQDIRAYQLIRSEVQYEYGAMANRITWLVTSQAFLFTAYVLGVKEPDTKLCESLFHPLIPILGVIMCIILYLGSYGATVRIKAYRDQQKKLDKKALCGWIGCQPKRNRAVFFGFFPPVLIPGVFLSSWVELLGLSQTGMSIQMRVILYSLITVILAIITLSEFFTVSEKNASNGTDPCE